MAAFIAPLIGGIAGLFNKRPAVSPQNPAQTQALNGLIPGLSATANNAAQIDQVQQRGLYDQIARSQAGAGINATHALVGAGLGHSGLLANALMQVANQGQASRAQADLGLQQQAVQQKQLSIQDLLQAIGINTSSVPGQSSAGAFMNGLAPVLAYSLQNSMNQRGGTPALGSWGGLLGPGTPGVQG